MKNLNKIGVVIILSGLLVLVYRTHVIGAEWKHLYDAENYRILYEAESITRTSPSIIKMWNQIIPKDEETRSKDIQELKKAGMKFKDYGSTLWLYEIDCIEKKYRAVLMVDYDKYGQELNRIENESAKWEATNADHPLFVLASSYLPKEVTNNKTSVSGALATSSPTEKKEIQKSKETGSISTQESQSKAGIMDKLIKESKSMLEKHKDIIGKTILFSIIIMTLAGIILGVTNRAVFYMDKKDLFISFLPVLSIIIFAMMADKNSWSIYLGIAIFMSTIVYIFYKAYDYNHNILYCICTGIAKISLSLLWLCALWTVLFPPRGKNRREQREIQLWASIILGLVSALVYRLINGENIVPKAKAVKTRPITTFKPVKARSV